MHSISGSIKDCIPTLDLVLSTAAAVAQLLTNETSDTHFTHSMHCTNTCTTVHLSFYTKFSHIIHISSNSLLNSLINPIMAPQSYAKTATVLKKYFLYMLRQRQKTKGFTNSNILAAMQLHTSLTELCHLRCDCSQLVNKL